MYMDRINLLDSEISNKIAAGEVVERPASVVKELIENSIDAGAKHIDIEIEDGGQSLIRVIDDGIGIHPEDIEKAFLPHATSKISNIEDLFKILTMGFRGEALPSIASVSKISLASKQKDMLSGKEISFHGGINNGFKEEAMNEGTLIEVRDLFYNVPARKKFLKSMARETALIGDIINRIALSHADIAFSFTNNEKLQFNSYGNGNIIDVIRKVYGKNTCDNLIKFQRYGDELSVYGYIGNSEISRGSRNNQSIFVNKRFIKSRLVTAAVENAFKSFATINKFPFFVIYIDIYPELIDVNIHPSKSEIKFKDERFIFKFIFDSVHAAIKESVKESFMLPEEAGYEQTDTTEELTFNFNNLQNHTIREATNPLDYPLQKDDSVYDIAHNIREKSIVDIPVDLSKDTNKALEYIIDKQHDNTKEAAKFPDIKIIGQFDKTYIIGEQSKNLYLVDQHAAHEKIMFEKYTREIKNHKVVIQPLLIPEVIELNIDDYSYFMENLEIFKTAGFNVEEFGDNTIVIKEVPYVIGKSKTRNLFLSILDNLKNLGSGKTEEYKYDTIARMACRSAVKANEELTMEEMKSLLEDLRYCDEPFNCPHGRPTIIKLTLYELEKLFKRIQ